MKPQAIRGHLDLLVLSVLGRGARHGYAIIEELRDRSDGAFEFPEGTIYPALHRLERDGLVASRWQSGDGRRRRTYALTARGRRALGDQRGAWRRFAQTVDAVVGDGGAAA